MRIKDFIPSLHGQMGKILQRFDGTVWVVNGIDYRLGILHLEELNTIVYVPVKWTKIGIFSKDLQENFTELEKVE